MTVGLALELFIKDPSEVACNAPGKIAGLCANIGGKGSEAVKRDGFNKVLTIPNALSALRVAGVPIFLWLALQPYFGNPSLDGWAISLLVVSGGTDYLDGKLARRWNQVTRLGQILDPAADRLYTVSTLLALLLRDIIPWWFLLLLLARDIFMAFNIATLRRIGYGPLRVNFIGKAATFNLMYAFPLLLFADGEDFLADYARIFGWALAIWGAALYWWSAALYATQVHQLRGKSLCDHSNA
ncbi:CDP-alcohol phosphatidyltransferase family protein [Streptomyces sp. NBC_01481]|uniref:CDP-alcohol phosphatidyltransferase family protein n=1 Tax=Streptomyces sp. NBC_01481 TaxID=2975869 RepID=UPI00224F30CF|nr:CDP-alcohol phosphatidyltransferase family protein [Streptomyces sp. NBC_01481]MCX4586980.1 CDP-alcohol phosphatidyltransferase family protein [Streptomyces sp. NBC_01481]